jgi:hypothetical protein
MPETFPWYWPERTHNLWRYRRERGALQFVLVFGVLTFGGIEFLGFFALWDVIGFRSRSLLSTAHLAVLCFSFGLAWGVLAWYIGESLFKRHGEARLDRGAP